MLTTLGIMGCNSDLPPAQVQGVRPDEMSMQGPTVRVEVGEIIYTVGRDNRSEAEQLSGPFTGVLFEDSTILLADLKSRATIIAGPSVVPQLFATQGQGPGEIQHPSILLSNIGGYVGIIDNALRRLTQFRLSDDTSEVVGIFPTSHQPVAGCSVGSEYATLQYSPEHPTVFGVFDVGGKPRTRFGDPFVIGTRLQMFMETQGRFICIADPARFIVATSTGELRSYGFDGTLNWRKAIPQFLPGSSISRGTEYLAETIAPGQDSSRLVAGLVQLRENLAIVQLQEYVRSDTSPASAARAGVRSFIFNVEDGNLLGIQQDLPLLLSATKSLMLLYHPEDAPWLSIRPYIETHQSGNQ